MNFISKLAKGSLKTNKSKSLLIGITIILTTTLLASIGIICSNWIEANKEVTIGRSGSFHAIYKRVEEQQIKKLENHLEIESFGVLRTIGVSQYEENNLGLVYIDKNAVEMSNVEFVEGQMPVRKDEIAIQDGFLNFLNNEAKVGEPIKVKYESRETGEVKEKEFILSGLIKTSQFNIANKNYTAVVSEEFLNGEEAYENMEFNAYVRVKGEEKSSGATMKFKAKEIAEEIGISEFDVKINKEYIDAMRPDPAVIGGGVAIVLIVILSSVLVIYSIFYVSIINKVQEYGKLRAIGATKKQIKGIILREGMALAAIAVPIGLALGYIMGKIIIDKLIIKGMYEVGSFNIPILVVVFVVSFATVFISLIKPMKIASRVSPVEAMRFNGEEEKKKKERKGYEWLNIKRLTYANIARNKKRAVITLASLGLSGILFITMSTIMSSMNAEKMVRGHMPGDFKLSLANYTYGTEDEPVDSDFNVVQENNPLGAELRAEILKIPGVKEIKSYVTTWAEFVLPSGEKNKSSISGFGDEYYDELKANLVEGEINRESLEEGNGVVYTFPSYAEEYGIKVGEKIKLKIYDGLEFYEREFVIEAISYVGGDDFRIPECVMAELVKTDITSSIDIMVEDENSDSVKDNLKQIADGNYYLELNTIEEEIKLYEEMLTLTKILGYSLVIIIGVIGFMNLINTMITSIITRKRELGMLQAIGLSNKQLVKMLQIEGLFYTVGTLLITLTFGNVIGYIAYVVFKNTGASYAVYSYPLIPTILLILSVTIAQLLITYLVSNNFNKQSLIDRVRYSE